MKINLILFFALSAFFSVSAQTKFLPGYLVKNEGDTVRGYIQDADNNWSIKTVRFAQTPGATPIEYQLSSFKSLYMEESNEYYLVETVSIDKKPVRTDQLENVPGRKIVNETILLLLLTGGKINLYKYTDENGKVHFFTQKDGKTEELGYVRYFAGGNLGELRFYINTLKNMTSDCDKIKSTNPDYTEKDLSKLISTYNSCFGEVKQYVKEKAKLSISGGILAGVRRSSYDFNGVDQAFLDGADNTSYNSTINPTAGVFFEISPKRSGKFIFGAQILWQEAGTFEGTSETNVDTYAEYKTKFTFLNPGIYLQYRLIKNDKFPLFIKVGGGYNFILKSTSEAEVFSISRNITLRKKPYTDFRYGINLHGGLGLSYPKWMTEIRFQQEFLYGDGFTKGTLPAPTIVLGYKLF